MRNLRLELCYDGTRYRGWQRLPGVENTIQGKLEKTLSRILEEPIEIIGSGRTDAGTHALGQVANFHCINRMPSEEILRKLREFLPEDMGVYSCKEVSPRFHARLNALEKTYCYRLWNSEEPCVFQRRYVYGDSRPLNLEAMEQAAEHLVGTHDFSAFCGNKNQKKSTVRTIYRIEILPKGHELQFLFTGDGFLYHMVRILVGTLLEVGRGEREPETISALFGKRRELAGQTVPACGLCLMEVKY